MLGIIFAPILIIGVLVILIGYIVIYGAAVVMAVAVVAMFWHLPRLTPTIVAIAIVPAIALGSYAPAVLQTPWGGILLPDPGYEGLKGALYGMPLTMALMIALLFAAIRWMPSMIEFLLWPVRVLPGPLRCALAIALPLAMTLLPALVIGLVQLEMAGAFDRLGIALIARPDLIVRGTALGYKAWADGQAGDWFSTTIFVVTLVGVLRSIWVLRQDWNPSGGSGRGADPAPPWDD